MPLDMMLRLRLSPARVWSVLLAGVWATANFGLAHTTWRCVDAIESRTVIGGCNSICQAECNSTSNQCDDTLSDCGSQSEGVRCIGMGNGMGATPYNCASHVTHSRMCQLSGATVKCTPTWICRCHKNEQGVLHCISSPNTAEYSGKEVCTDVDCS